MKEGQLIQFKELANKLATEGKENASLTRKIVTMQEDAKRNLDREKALRDAYNKLQVKCGAMESRCNALVDQIREMRAASQKVMV